MSTVTDLGGGRYRHRESVPFSMSASRTQRARTLDAAGVARVIDREVDKALRPFKVQMRKLDRQIDAVDEKIAAAAKLAPFTTERDTMRRAPRQPTAQEVNAANRAHYGRDAEGRRPGDLGFGMHHSAVRDAAAGAASPAAAINAMNRKLWGRA